MVAILQMTFFDSFSWMIVLYFDENFTEVQGSNQQQFSIGSGNGLAPSRRQAIISTNDVYASIGLDEVIDIDLPLIYSSYKWKLYLKTHNCMTEMHLT